MSQITLYQAIPVRVYKQATGIAGSATSAGQLMRFDGDNGHFLPTTNGSPIAGISITTIQQNGRMTVVEEGLLDVGSALNSIGFGSYLYACASAGKLETASAIAVGKVVPAFGTGGTADKLLEVTAPWRV